MTTARLACLVVVAFLLLGPLQSSAKDCKYQILTRTGTRKGAGTDATVSIRLYGSHATCGWRRLDTPANDFEKGRNDYFTITCPCLGCISKFRIKHNNRGRYPGLYLETVSIRVLPDRTFHLSFPCYQWLSRGSRLEREFTSAKNAYIIKVHTRYDDAKSAQISLWSNRVATRLTPLNGPFKVWSIMTTYASLRNICPLKKIYLRVNAPSWRIKLITVYDRSARVTYDCPCFSCLVKTFSPRIIACYARRY